MSSPTVELSVEQGVATLTLTDVSRKNAMSPELGDTGRRFDGREAVRLGLALEAVPAGEVLARAQALAAQVASGGPLAVRALKKNLGVDRAALQQALENEALAQGAGYGSDDLQEGLRAATERRAPRFSAA